jgi:hypothetical protein
MNGMRHAIPLMVLLGAAFTVTGVTHVGGAGRASAEQATPDAREMLADDRGPSSADSVEPLPWTRAGFRRGTPWYEAPSPDAYNDEVFCVPRRLDDVDETSRPGSRVDRRAGSAHPRAPRKRVREQNDASEAAAIGPITRPCASYPGPWAPSVEDDSALYMLPYPALHHPLKPQ